jgi:hypothetical protein
MQHRGDAQTHGGGNESEATSEQSEESREHMGKPGVVYDSDFNFSVDSENKQGEIENDDEGGWDEGGSAEGGWDAGDLDNGEESDESLVHVRKRRNQVLDESDTDETNKCWTSSDSESENNEATPPKRSYVKRNHKSKAAKKLFKKKYDASDARKAAIAKKVSNQKEKRRLARLAKLAKK